jgi:xylan 1,4-beta-xylosidase
MSRLKKVNNWQELARATGYDCSQLAAACRISQSQLNRFFVQRFGVSTQKWLKEVRLTRVAELALDPRLSIKEIASELSYSSESLLCHQFKRKYGCSLTQYASRASNASSDSNRIMTGMRILIAPRPPKARNEFCVGG